MPYGAFPAGPGRAGGAGQGGAKARVRGTSWPVPGHATAVGTQRCDLGVTGWLCDRFHKSGNHERS
ncbi:hypothetical protein GCM10010349_14620 [Streptomyces flavofungini]|nr:hypothetical protein GCM10010349_14620 [Streptomyces flavofungini]